MIACYASVRLSYLYAWFSNLESGFSSTEQPSPADYILSFDCQSRKLGSEHTSDLLGLMLADCLCVRATKTRDSASNTEVTILNTKSQHNKHIMHTLSCRCIYPDIQPPSSRLCIRLQGTPSGTSSSYIAKLPGLGTPMAGTPKPRHSHWLEPRTSSAVADSGPSSPSPELRASHPWTCYTSLRITYAILPHFASSPLRHFVPASIPPGRRLRAQRLSSTLYCKFNMSWLQLSVPQSGPNPTNHRVPALVASRGVVASRRPCEATS
ncbi:hypothetical protein C8Q74DRAFT_587420 [Fomes fomentarius]|nr:hypothetical protein C8Q74DRAFT_587420 [Fomes fomentarius]